MGKVVEGEGRANGRHWRHVGELDSAVADARGSSREGDRRHSCIWSRARVGDIDGCMVAILLLVVLRI